MRRIALAALVSVAAAAGVIALTGARGGGSGYRVDAIFDNAANLIPGQDVKIAGARVGSVKDVVVTPDRKARIEMDIDPRFAPFRSDADCIIRPQSLIGEKFIECHPGTPRGRKLTRHGDTAPTVPVSRTHSPVDIDLVFAALRLPYRQRLQVVVNELGTGLAGRGEDLNAAIRRANPAIAESDRVLRILDRDRARLGAIVDEAEAIVGELARRRGAVTRFVDRAAAVTEATAEHRGPLAETVRRLPALLDEARPSLDRLAELASASAPVLDELHAAAPQLSRLTGDLAPLARAARPALVKLGRTAGIGIRTVRVARPVVAQLRAFTAVARPTGSLVEDLFQSLRARGVVEGLQSFVYFAAAATSRFDRFSHIIPAHVLGGECTQYASTPVPACDAHFAKPASSRDAARARVTAGARSALEYLLR